MIQGYDMAGGLTLSSLELLSPYVRQLQTSSKVGCKVLLPPSFNYYSMKERGPLMKRRTCIKFLLLGSTTLFLVVALMGCGGSGGSGGGSSVHAYLTYAPSSIYNHVWITIVSVQIHTTDTVSYTHLRAHETRH